MYIFQTVTQALKPTPPMQNHHPETISTSPKFFARQFFWTQTPFRISIDMLIDIIPITVFVTAIVLILFGVFDQH